MTAAWANALGHRICASLAITSFSRTACGARIQPTRRPGAKVLENVLT